MNSYLTYRLARLIAFVAFISTNALFFHLSNALAEANEVQALESKVETLKKRVQELEAIKAPKAKTKKGARNRWDSLVVGQSKKDVSAILGKPGKVHKWKTGEAWYYPDTKGGEVDFDVNGKVTGWLEP